MNRLDLRDEFILITASDVSPVWVLLLNRRMSGEAATGQRSGALAQTV